MKELETKLVNYGRSLTKVLVDLSDSIFKDAELSGFEFKSCKRHTDILEKYDFDVEYKYMGFETGFRAEYDSGIPGPCIAFLSEYDALPDIGHGCGHNMLGASSTGAGITLKYILDQIGGKVVVLGTPAEETIGSKVIFAKEGAFNDITVAMSAHPGTAYYRSGDSLCLIPLQFEFKGKTSHASSAPWNGISAYDASIITATAINALIAHITPDSRVHGIIVDGGKAANVIPDYSKMQYYVRAAKKSYALELAEKVTNCARAGALATGCELTISEFENPNDNLITNGALSSAFEKALFDVCGKTMLPPRKSVGSTDMGNVSHVCPTIHCNFDIANGANVSGHTIETAELTQTEYAKEQMINTVCALALTGMRVIQDKQLLTSIQEEFNNIIE